MKVYIIKKIWKQIKPGHTTELNHQSVYSDVEIERPNERKSTERKESKHKENNIWRWLPNLSLRAAWDGRKQYHIIQSKANQRVQNQRNRDTQSAKICNKTNKFLSSFLCSFLPRLRLSTSQHWDIMVKKERRGDRNITLRNRNWLL